MSLRVWLPLNGDLRNQGSANVTITNSGTVVKVYQNNEIIGSFNAGNEITNANDLVIGAKAASTDAESTAVYFTGQMSDFRIYATALSADDIKELYENREKRG